MRTFIGLINSIRRVVLFEVVKQIQILTPLTSSSKLVNFEPLKHHFEAFETIKSMLLKEPLFCNLIKPYSTKYLWVDAATSSNCLGAVLVQRIDREISSPIYWFGWQSSKNNFCQRIAIWQVLHTTKFPFKDL